VITRDEARRCRKRRRWGEPKTFELNVPPATSHPDSAMSYLFRIEKGGDPTQQLLGYDWIEVLAIEPWALAHPSPGYGEWCDRTISVNYVCLTEAGLVRITSDDFWSAVEQSREYAGESAESGAQGTVIRAGDRSFVQVASTVVGNVLVGDKFNLLHELPHEQLVAELARLREALKAREGTAGQNLDFDLAIGALAEAEQAVRSNDGAGFVRSLMRVGKGVAALAREIGVDVAAGAITKALGS
jgi:hypothetical protein